MPIVAQNQARSIEGERLKLGSAETAASPIAFKEEIMKKTPFLLIVLACFIGVIAALQIDHLWHRDKGGELLASGDNALHNAMPAVDPAEQPAGAADFRLAAKRVIPSVVSVDQYSRVQTYFDQSAPLQETGTGSGVIISKDGIIVTNNHVVQMPGNPSQVVDEVRVRLSDKRTYKAEVVGRDPRSDLAVLRIKADNLQPIELADSSKIEVGQWVVAVGNPLGFESTVSAGVISSLGRSLGLENSYLLDGIQTDAAINPGNSGGALTDVQGRLVGINSAIASQTGNSIGIGFAIPANRVRQVADEILKKGYVQYAGLGFAPVRRFDGILQDPDARRDLQQLTGAEPPRGGILIAPNSVARGSAAEKAGLKGWDVIVSLDGQKVDDTLALNKLLNNKKPGDKVKLEFWSRGETKTVDVALQELQPIR